MWAKVYLVLSQFARLIDRQTDRQIDGWTNSLIIATSRCMQLQCCENRLCRCDRTKHKCSTDQLPKLCTARTHRRLFLQVSGTPTDLEILCYIEYLITCNRVRVRFSDISIS